MKKFVEALNKVLSQFGRKIIIEKRFVNLLADYNAFQDNPAFYNILNVCVQEGFFVEIDKIISTRRFSDTGKFMLDMQRCVNRYKVIIKGKIQGGKEVDDIIDLLAKRMIPDYGNTDIRRIRPVDKQSMREARSEDKSTSVSMYMDVIATIVCSLVAIIGGNAIYLLYVSGKCWMSVTFLLSTLFQGSIFCHLYNMQDKWRPSVVALFVSFLSVTVLNTLMPIFLSFDGMVEFFSGFLWNSEELLSGLYKDRVYEGGFFTYIYIAIVIFSTLIVIGITLDKKFPKEQNVSYIYVIIGYIIASSAIIPYLNIGFSSLNKYEERCAEFRAKIENEVQVEIARIKRLGEERKQQEKQLTFKGIELGANIYDVRKLALHDSENSSVSLVTTDVHYKPEYSTSSTEEEYDYPECSKFSYSTHLNKDYVDVTVDDYKGKIYRICVSRFSRDLLNVYTEKYGEPTIDSSRIRKIVEERYSIEPKTWNGYLDGYHWEFKNSSITINDGVEYSTTYLHKYLYRRMKLYRDSVVKQAKEEAKRREREQFIKDSLEEVSIKEKQKAAEEAAKIKQYNDI